MKRKRHITHEKTTENENIVVSGPHNGIDTVDKIMKPEKTPELTLAQQQDLAKRIMRFINDARRRKPGLSGIMTTLRDIVTCTDSFLIRASAYAVAAVLILCLLGGLFMAVTLVTSYALADHAGFSFSRPFAPIPSSPESPMGRISYARSVESFLLNNT